VKKYPIVGHINNPTPAPHMTEQERAQEAAAAAAGI